MIEVDINATRNRIRRLRRYVQHNLLNENGFICPAYGPCFDSRTAGDDFREGTMSHVGKRFDLTLDGKPLRIVVVGQESGRPKDPQFAQRVTLDARYRQVRDRSGNQRRYYTEEGYPGRNPHMRGTTSALRVILGAGLGSDYEGELIAPVNGKPFHVFDGFALVNRLLCSAGPPETSIGRPSPTMFENCGSHFEATLEILEPTLVVLQGSKVAKWVTPIFQPIKVHDQFLHEAQFNGQRVLVCSFSHPSAHGSLRWGDRLDAPYLTEVVVPTLTKAMKL